MRKQSIFILVLTLLAASQVFAFPRKVLLEYFTNTS